MQIDMTRLREEKRPLWMSPLGIEDFSDLIGNGGDIWTDRLVPAWERYYGSELSTDEEKLFNESSESSESNVQAESSANVEQDSSGLGVNVNVGLNADVSGATDTVSDTVSGIAKTAGGLLGGVKKKVKDIKK